MRWAATLGVVALALLALGIAGHHVVREKIQARLADDLSTLLQAEVTALDLWIQDQVELVHTVARYDAASRRLYRVATEAPARGSVDALRASPAMPDFQAYAGMLAPAFGYQDVVLITPDGRTVASLVPEALGLSEIPTLTPAFQRALRGETVFATPFLSEVPVPGASDPAPRIRPNLIIFSPVFGEPDEVVGVLGFRMDAEGEFSHILKAARLGDTGETYAFNAEGVLISDSRFPEDLRATGLLPEDPSVPPILNVAIRDPGVDLTAGKTAAMPRGAQPLTHMAASAVAGVTGTNVGGYRDYRGVEVVGAWTWFDAYGFGVATEIDKAEGYRGLHFLARVFWVLFGLVCAGALGGLVSAWFIGRLSRRVHEAMQVGQYTLEQKIGEGGMGKVYRARHALLRRPTAVKILAETNPQAVARFEREVQLTAGLTSPHTVAVYDYGVAKGVFYYAMEYLPGINLARLVKQHGPQPPARVIHMLRQACSSLAEAHGVGLIHRDIKPGNMILCQRGGVLDVLKVLDFGLVKEIKTPEEESELTRKNTVTGTPNYAAPECLSGKADLDARSDLYSLGVVGFVLLTGKRPFEGSVMEVMMHHLRTPAPRPSEVVERDLPADLEAVILSCLEKSPGDRPASALALNEALAACADARGWSQSAARAWWEDHGGLPVEMEDVLVREQPTTTSEPPTLEIDLGARAR